MAGGQKAQNQELPLVSIARALSPTEELESDPNGFIICCPGHPGNIASGSLRPSETDPEGPPIIECWEGLCDESKIVNGLRRRKLWRWDEKPKGRKDGLVTARLDRRFIGGNKPWNYEELIVTSYTGRGATLNDETWRLIGQVFRQSLSTEDGTVVKLEDVQLRPTETGWRRSNGYRFAWPIYNKRAVAEKAFNNGVVFCVDDESDCDLLEFWDLTGFCHRGGVRNPKGFVAARPESVLTIGQGAKACVLIPNLDQKSMSLARKKAFHLHKNGIKVYFLTLDMLPVERWPEENGPGLIEWNENFGGSKERLVELVLKEKYWEPGEIDIAPEVEARAEVIEPGQFLQASKYWKTLVKKEPLCDPWRHMLTEFMAGMFFVKFFGDRVRFLTKEKKWLAWDGTVWLEDEECPSKLYQIMVTQMRADLIGGGVDPEKVDKFCFECKTASRISAALKIAKSWLGITAKELNQIKWKLPCKNGIINLETGALEPHNAELFYTKRIDLTYHGVDYGDTGCPTSWAFIKAAFYNDIPMLMSVIECHAVGLTGDSRFRKCFLNFGTEGREGKSTICEAILNIMGLEVFARSVSKTLICTSPNSNKFNDPGNAHDMRFLLMDEIGSDDRVDRERFKSMTGNDSIAGSRMYKDAVTKQSTHNLYGFANATPKFNAGADTAARERLVLIKWPRHIKKTEEDPRIKQTILTTELEGVLSVLVQACVSIHLRGYIDIHSQIERDTEDFFNSEDLFGIMLSEVFERCEEEEGWLYLDRIHEEQVDFFRDQDMKPWTKIPLGRELVKRGFKSYKDSAGLHFYKGIRINAAWANRPRQSKYKDF